MELFFVNQWEENKDALRAHFATTPQSEYDSYEAIVELVLSIAVPLASDWCDDGWRVDQMTVLDHGHYQGTKLFIVPKDTYQPCVSNYIIIDVSYGSCSGCDTLQAITSYDEELPSEDQINQYMTLCLHIVQNMRWLRDA